VRGTVRSTGKIDADVGADRPGRDCPVLGCRVSVPAPWSIPTQAQAADERLTAEGVNAPDAAMRKRRAFAFCASTIAALRAAQLSLGRAP
jgi:hypothetical protein